MNDWTFGTRPSYTLCLVLSALTLLVACGDDDPGGGPIIGNPVNPSIPITHEVASATAERNLRNHIDSLDSSLTFLENSDALEDFFSMLSDEDSAEAEPEFEIDLAELRDGILEVMTEDIMREEAATVSQDGLTLTYALNPEMFCVDDEAAPDESPEDRMSRLHDEAECTDRIAEHALRLNVTSDAPGDLNLELLHGMPAISALRVQLHDDMIALFMSLPRIKELVEVLVSPEDFELPRTMDGELAIEIRRHNPLMYGARFAILEDIHVMAAADQDGFSLQIPAAAEAAALTIDGEAATIDGALHIEAIDASVPWQIIVDMFYDEEGHSETRCETNPETGEENCEEVWIDPAEAPSVDETLFVSIPGVHGELAYRSDTDDFRFAGMSLGDTTTTVRVDDAQIIGFDLNPDDGRSLGLTVRSLPSGDMELVFEPGLDARLEFAWNRVQSAFEDLPEVLLDDTIGIRMNSSSAPALRIRAADEDIELEVASGQLTLWSANMSEDVVIEAGQCIQGADDSMLTDEEREAQHELFGGLTGGTCGGE